MKRFKHLFSLALILTLIFSISVSANNKETKDTEEETPTEVVTNDTDAVDKIEEEPMIIDGVAVEVLPEGCWMFDYSDFIDPDASEADRAKLQETLDQIKALEEELGLLWDEVYESEAFNDEAFNDELFGDEIYLDDMLIDGELLMDEDWIVEPFTFDLFKEELKDDLTPEQLVEVEALFDQAIALDEKGDYEAAGEIWEQLFEMDIFDMTFFEVDMMEMDDLAE